MMPDRELHLTEVGSGRPVLVLHGGPGLDQTYLRPWLDPLGSQCRLIYLDFRGNGRSAEPASWRGVTHADWVADVEAVRRDLGEERLLVFGHSYGGYIALEHATAHPDRVAGLMLCSTAPAADAGAESFAIAQQRATPEQLQVLGEAFAAPREMTAGEFSEVLEAITPLYFHGAPPDFARLFGSTVFRPAAFTHMFFECMPHYDVVGELKKVRAPTLILHGRHDWIAPFTSSALRLRDHLPSARLEVFEQSGHYPFVEEPDRFRAVVAEWLAEIDR